MTALDPVDLTRRLIRCPSVTPEEGGAIGLLEGILTEAGFDCTRIERGGITNLFARYGRKGANRTLGFNGHIDVVPIGDIADWSVDPFGGEEKDGYLWGRGATDMKSGVAAWVAAAVDFVNANPDEAALILTITGDEEADAIDGTAAILDWMSANGEQMTSCVVGEPTSPDEMGQMMKIGRRGSISAFFTARGVQGHSAYPHRAKNPIHALSRLVTTLAGHELDTGNDHFDPSTLQVVTFDTGNPATNVIPASCRATVNIRFNDEHSSDSLRGWLEAEAAKVTADTGVEIDLRVKVTGESFLTPPGEMSDLVGDAVEAELGRRPELSTTGGTSDARYVKDHCPVVEFGLVGRTMHEVDERVSIAQIHQLKAIYTRIITAYFA